jgi:8-oxo-dGTP pyrophosphatase MutT (NUDIX family)
MYKVFIENKPFIFTRNVSNQDLNILQTDKSEDVQKMIHHISLVPKEGLLINCVHPEQLFRDTFQSYKKIEAAGGLVFRDKKLLLIHRFGMWDLPKGKIEKVEYPEEAALREIKEECGVNGHQIICRLQDTWHTYRMNGHNVLKQTYWYFMSYEGAGKLKPQKEEDILEARWVILSDLPRFKAQMYPSLLPVLSEAIELIDNGTVFG